MAEQGIARDDLARTSPPDWLGRPDPAAVSFVLPHHRHVQSDPRHLVRLGSNLLTVAEQAASSETGPDLVKLLTVYALQPRLPGFRGVVPPLPETSFQAALDRAGAGNVGERVAELPESLHVPLARLIFAATTSAELVDASWDGVPRDLLHEALALRDVPRLLPGGSVTWPSLNRLVGAGHVPGDVDRAAAAVRLADAVQRAAAALSEIQADMIEPWRVETRWGEVAVTGSGDDEVACDDCFVLVDLGGDDVWSRTARAHPGTAGFQPAASGGASGNVSVVLDLSGHDLYRGAFASGRGGVAVVYDAAGNDRYVSKDDAFGHGFLGYGLLFDASGDDRYSSAGGSQGSAVFGGGVVIDGSGDDRYEIHGEGQGFGGPGAVGALVDLGGDDVYRAEPDPARAPGRADYHSDGEVNASNAQGAGVGRRGDLTDGHLWGGGVGVLADVSGNDRYEAGNFAQASGYAYGTGLLLDGAGDDAFATTYFSQGSAAHEAAALLFDGSGNDRHELAVGAGLGYGWDCAIGMMIDLGGDDRYRAQKLALGSSDLSSLGLFLELAGADAYASDEGSGLRLLGASGSDGRNAEGPPHHAADSVRDLGLFLDLGGFDIYPRVRGAEPADGEHWRGSRGGFGIDKDLEFDADDSEIAFFDWLYAPP